MPLQIISISNPRIKSAARLRDRKGRDAQQRIIIDGVREISRALAAGVQVVELYFISQACQNDEHKDVVSLARRAGAELIEVTPNVMAKVAYGSRVEGVIAVATPPIRSLAEWRPAADAIVAVVEGIEKPGNLGAILRTADAAGVAGLIVADGGTDVYNPNAIRASLGAIFTVPVFAATNEETLAWLRTESFRMLAARVDGALEYTQADFRGRVAIVLGSEAGGLTDSWGAEDIQAIRLPLVGSIDSLNLSATAAVLFYEALRQRTALAGDY